MPDVTEYEAPAVTDVTEVDKPLIALGSLQNPQWNDDVDES